MTLQFHVLFDDFGRRVLPVQQKGFAIAQVCGSPADHLIRLLVIPGGGDWGGPGRGRLNKFGKCHQFNGLGIETKRLGCRRLLSEDHILFQPAFLVDIEHIRQDALKRIRVQDLIGGDQLPLRVLQAGNRHGIAGRRIHIH